MKTANYSVALITRGTGACAYTYRGPARLKRGALALVTFRDKLELGVVLGRDKAAKKDQEYNPLLSVGISGIKGWSELLLGLVELFVAAPDELAGHLLFERPATGLRLEFSIPDPGSLPKALVSRIGALAGRLTPKARSALLAACSWEQLVQYAQDGAVAFAVSIAGTPGVTRAHPRWRRWFQVDPDTARLHGLPQSAANRLPGSYLEGFADAGGFGDCPVAQDPVEMPEPPKARQPDLSWQELQWDAGWEIVRMLPELADVVVHRAQASWAGLRGKGGLAAELGRRIAEGNNTLLIAPQGWMLNRIWQDLAPWAGRVHRFKSDAGPSVASFILGRLAKFRGQVVAGGPGTWKLAAYADFDGVIMLDPSHPQYQPERHPRLDPRLALLRVAARRGLVLDLVELGLSAWDGATRLKQVALLDQFEPVIQQQPRAQNIDTNPIPLELRQVGRKRLIYFNRLGKRRGLQCVECGTQVGCPHCGALGVYFSGATGEYICSRCRYKTRELRCQQCGLATLAAQLPGLESVVLREGDYLATGAAAKRSSHPEYQSVLGTSQLLEPLAGFWPEELVYIHADSRPALLDDWPAALDQTARLGALYDNPELDYAYIVSTRLREQLGESLSAAQIAGQWEAEMKLRKLAGLPPFGSIHRIKLKAKSRKAVLAGRKIAGAFLKGHPATSMLRLGRPFPAQGAVQLVGYFVNREITPEMLLDLRWQSYRKGAQLEISAIRGPWL